MLAEHWWSRPVRIPWEQILTQKAAVVIDFGGLRPSKVRRTPRARRRC